MFTKMFSPAANSYFLENSPAPLANVIHGGVTRTDDRSWLALGLVLCAHLAVFAALRPQPQSLPLETVPEPIMVSLLSAPQAMSQKPKPPTNLKQKVQRTVTAKTIEKNTSKNQAKPTPAVRKIPVVARSQPTRYAATSPIEQTSTPLAEASSQPFATGVATTISKPATDAQTYQSASFNAAYLLNPAPDYPSVSRRLGEQGKVLLRVQVTVDGAASSVALQTSSGSTRLDQAALEAVKKWRFVPAKRGGQAVSAAVVVPVSFSIEG